jgi:hypothetical protein
MKNQINLLLFFTILSSSATYNAMNAGLFGIIASLFKSTPAQTAAQASAQAALQIAKKYPVALPYAQHTPIRASRRIRTMNRLAWEQEAQEIVTTKISDPNLFYSFDIWCHRLKADAYKQARLNQDPQPFTIAPIETPDIVLAQLMHGSRPLIQKNSI